MKYIALEHYPTDSRLKIVENEICQCLTSRMGTGGGNVPLVMVIEDEKDIDNIERPGGAVMGWNYKELAATLRAQMASHPPVVVIEDGDSIRSVQSDNDMGCDEFADGGKGRL